MSALKKPITVREDHGPWWIVPVVNGDLSYMAKWRKLQRSCHCLLVQEVKNVAVGRANIALVVGQPCGYQYEIGPFTVFLLDSFDQRVCNDATNKLYLTVGDDVGCR